MPDHPGLLVLILEDEFKFLTSPAVLPSGKQSPNRDHPIPCEKPVVLRTSSPTRRAVTGGQAASEVRIADPRLVQCDLSPSQRSIGIGVRRVDLQGMPEQVGVMIGSSFLKRIAILQESLRNRTDVLPRSAAGDYDSRCLLATAGSNREGQPTRVPYLLTYVLSLIMLHAVGRANTRRKTMCQFSQQ